MGSLNNDAIEISIFFRFLSLRILTFIFDFETQFSAFFILSSVYVWTTIFECQ